MRRKAVFQLCLVLPLLLFSRADDRWSSQLARWQSVYDLIMENYPQAPDTRELVFASIRGLLGRLDPHSYFLDPVSFRSMIEDQQGNYFGIGIRVTKFEERLTVLDPLKGSPADLAGMQAGDVIIEIDGEQTRTMTLDMARGKLRGVRDSEVGLTVVRQGIGEPVGFRIRRQEIPLNSITFSLALSQQPEIGYISLRTFAVTTLAEFKTSLELLLRRQRVNALIIDLRGNPGGSLAAAVDLTDLFLEKGKLIVSLRGRKMSSAFYARRNHQYEHLPVAVLINRGSASASEIVAAALQFHGRASVVGQRSWGKGMVETVHRLSQGCALALTSAKYYTPGGVSLQREYSALDDYYFFLIDHEYDHDRSIQGGVIPDRVVKTPLLSRLMVSLLSRGLFFEFARRVSRDPLVPVSRDFHCDEAVWDEFRRFLAEKGVAPLTDAELVANRTEIETEIVHQVLSDNFSAAEGEKVLLAIDPVVNQAVRLLRP